MSWIQPSDLAELVLPDSGVSLLAAACDGRLLTLAKYLVDAGARFIEEPSTKGADAVKAGTLQCVRTGILP